METKHHSGEIEKEKINWVESVKAMRHHSEQKFIISGISLVPEKLRKGNDHFYVPKVFSIGPGFRGRTKDRGKIEEFKWECITHLLQKVGGNGEEKFNEWGELIFGLEDEVRSTSYADDLKQMKWGELTKIMLYDACFTLALLICDEPDQLLPPTRRHDIFGENLELRSDLLVLDNQIPYLILRKLYYNIFQHMGRALSIESLALNYFGYSNPFRDSFSHAEMKSASHLVDLVHLHISMDPVPKDSIQVSLETREKIKPVQLNRCATRLQAAGVEIIPIPYFRDEQSRLPWALDFNIRSSSSSGTLEIPRLYFITRSTEVIWRNLIAWEHLKISTDSTFGCKCTSAALFFNALICCESDVQLLRDRGIIVDIDFNGSNQDMVTFFRSIVNGVDRDKIDSHYHFFHGGLNKYYRSPMNRATEIPIRFWHYLTGSPREVVRDLHNFLKRGYNFVAAMITILSLLQTVYTILSYYHPKKGS